MSERIIMNNKKKIICLFQSGLISCVITLSLLLLFALLIWKAELSDIMSRAGVTLIYIISAGAGGFLLGKRIRERKFLWGFLTGLLYFLILFFITVLTEGFSGQFDNNIITTFIICLLSGTLGGMIA